jgi:hypothetical protein
LERHSISQVLPRAENPYIVVLRSGRSATRGHRDHRDTRVARTRRADHVRTQRTVRLGFEGVERQGCLAVQVHRDIGVLAGNSDERNRVCRLRAGIGRFLEGDRIAERERNGRDVERLGAHRHLSPVIDRHRTTAAYDQHDRRQQRDARR